MRELSIEQVCLLTLLFRKRLPIIFILSSTSPFNDKSNVGESPFWEINVSTLVWLEESLFSDSSPCSCSSCSSSSSFSSFSSCSSSLRNETTKHIYYKIFFHYQIVNDQEKKEEVIRPIGNIYTYILPNHSGNHYLQKTHRAVQHLHQYLEQYGFQSQESQYWRTKGERCIYRANKKLANTINTIWSNR